MSVILLIIMVVIVVVLAVPVVGISPGLFVRPGTKEEGKGIISFL